jgi:replicative DNA helicase
MDREEAKEYIKANPEIYFRKAKKTGYVCPLCQNGAERDGTGISEIKGKEGLYKCFKCGESGDVFGFIGKEYGLNSFTDKLEKAYSIYGISVENNNFKNKRKDNMKHSIGKKAAKSSGVAQEPISEPAETDYTEFCKEVADHIEETNYLTERGISKELQKEFNIGYCKEWKHPDRPQMIPSERIIIPTSKSSYTTRAINNDEQYKVMKAGHAHLFNLAALYNKSEPVFIVEGEIDALSIIEAGGQAVALGSTSGAGLLDQELIKTKPPQPLILCLDTDDAGKTTTNKIIESLNEKGIPFMDKSSEVCCNKKDPNEALISNRDRFIDTIKSIIEDAKQKLQRDYDQEILDEFSDSLKYFEKEKQVFPTGFSQLDTFLDRGLYAGLYCRSSYGCRKDDVCIADSRPYSLKANKTFYSLAGK